MALSAASAAAAAPGALRAKEFLVFIGTYTGAKSKGIYVARFDTSTGRLSEPTLAAEVASPSFLAVHPNGRFLYSVNEVGNFAGSPAGAVSAFEIDRINGGLKLLNQSSSRGAGPCHLIVDPTGRNVLVANYGGGSVAVLPIGRDGTLGPASAFIQHTGSSVNPRRQREPHAHAVALSPDYRFAFVADLGLDQVRVYRFDARQGTLTPHEPAFAKVAPGSGPRHFAFHPSGKFAYVINEMLCTVTAFRYDARRGTLTETQTISTLPEGQGLEPDFSTAELIVHPSGKFLYGSNRGHDSLVVFRIDPQRGTLTRVQHQSTQGKTPRHFAIDPTGGWLLAENQNSDSIVVFRLDPATGRLTPTGQPLAVPTPVCVCFVPVERQNPHRSRPATEPN